VKKFLALAIVALVVPSVALAGKPTDPGHSQDAHGNSQSASHAPKVLYVLKGVITGITNGSTPVGQTVNTSAGPSPTTVSLSYTCSNGAVTINVTRVNHKRVFQSLTANNSPLTLTVCLSTTTKVIVKGMGRVALTDLGTISLGAKGNYGMVKVRYAKAFEPTADLQTFLTTGAKQVVVMKAAPTS
jgi:hypothetical protein